MNKLLVFFVIVLAGLGAGFWWYQQADQRLSEAPPRGGIEIGTSTHKSFADLKITLPFDQLEARANASAPKAFSKSGNGPDVCGKVVFQKVCTGTKYLYNVKRGKLTLSRKSDEAIRLTVPVNVAGNGGFRGDGAKLLDLDKKNFRAGVIAFADVSIALDKNWCPKPTVTTGFKWTDKAKVEIVHKAWIDISDAVEEGLRDQLAKMGRDAAKSLTCNQVRGPVEKAWSTSSTAFDLPGNAGRAYINVTPLEANFPGLKVNSRSIDVPVSLIANAEVSDQPIDVKRLPLPALKKKAVKKSQLSLTVPIRIPYATLTDLLAQNIVNQPMTAELPAGAATVTTREIRTYPSEKGLTVGALVDIDLPSRILDVKGWVYLTATPSTDHDGKRLVFSKVSFSRTLDNELWDAASIALEKTILEAVQRQSVIDLSDQIADTKAKVVEAAGKGQKDFQINISNPTIRLGTITTGQQVIVAQALFQSDAKIVLR